MGRTAATPADLARNGEMAGKLRALLAQRGWKIPDLNRAIGKDGGYSPTRIWLAGKSHPKGRNLAAVQRLLRETPVAALPSRTPPVTTRQADVLAFNVGADGEARIRLDVTLPFVQATTLLRQLLDAGLLMGTDRD